MAIFQSFFADLSPLVPTILRRMAPVVVTDDGQETSQNIINLAVTAGYQLLDAGGRALSEMMETSWPLMTASGWVLDRHWGPYHDVQRNGATDSEFRAFIRAKRLLNRSWGAADQVLEIISVLLPTAGTSWTEYYPKSWVVTITGVPMADAAEVMAFLQKKPSPLGGGFSVCGDNGMGVVVDPEAFNYSSVYGTMGVEYQVTGWYGSVYGAGGGTQAGFAHVQQI
jgi:hypothetical protein